MIVRVVSNQTHLLFHPQNTLATESYHFPLIFCPQPLLLVELLDSGVLYLLLLNHRLEVFVILANLRLDVSVGLFHLVHQAVHQSVDVYSK